MWSRLKEIFVIERAATMLRKLCNMIILNVCRHWWRSYNPFRGFWIKVTCFALMLYSTCSQIFYMEIIFDNSILFLFWYSKMLVYHTPRNRAFGSLLVLTGVGIDLHFINRINIMELSLHCCTYSLWYTLLVFFIPSKN